MKRPVVLMDLDNVIYPWADVMAVLMGRYGAVEEDHDALMSLYKSWSIWEDWGIPEGQFMQWWKRCVEADEGYTIGVPTRAAIKGLWELSDNEWHIHIVTSRLNLFGLHDEVVISTAKWLKNFGIPYRSLSFVEDKHRILGDAIIDDNPRNLIDHPAPMRLLFPAPHNREWAKTEEGTYEAVILGEEYPWSEIVETLGDGRE